MASASLLIGLHMSDGNIPVRCGNIAVTVLRGEGEGARVLLMRRSKGLLSGLWCQVTGCIEAGETGWAAALREVMEETGIQPLRLYSADFCDFFYDAGSNSVEAVPMFLVTVAASSEVLLNSENTEFCWVDLADAANMVPFLGHRVALREIRHDFIENVPMPWTMIWEQHAMAE